MYQDKYVSKLYHFLVPAPPPPTALTSPSQLKAYHTVNIHTHAKGKLTDKSLPTLSPKYYKTSCNNSGTLLIKYARHHSLSCRLPPTNSCPLPRINGTVSGYLLCGQFKEVALSLSAPHNNAIDADELPATPSLTTTTRLGAKQREITGVVYL